MQATSAKVRLVFLDEYVAKLQYMWIV